MKTKKKVPPSPKFEGRMHVSGFETDQVTVQQIPTHQQVSDRTRKEKCVSCCKKFIAFLFSTIGLSCLMIAWTIFGGFIFMKLESGQQVETRTTMADARKQFVQLLWNVTMEMNVFYEANWTRKANDLLKNYTDEVYKAIEHEGWDGKHEDADDESQWSFPGAMLYSITVITTIGYGHIAPKTLWGRLVTIGYAIIGIPLTLLTITNLGGFMATAFRFLYQNVCCGICCMCCPSKPRGRLKAVNNNLKYSDVTNAGETGLALTGGGGGGGGTNVDDPELGECDVVNPMPHPIDTVDQSMMRRKTVKGKRSGSISWRRGLQRALKTDDNKTIRVPIYISLLTITSYIMLGALLFTLWEDDWNMFIGAYFCFITLTTIGFGDYVPGTSITSWDSQEKLVLTALWLIIGLALIAMCFDLMQEEVRNKCKTLGQKLGILTNTGKTDKSKNKKSKKQRRQNSEKPKKITKSQKKKLKEDKNKESKKEKEKDKLVDLYSGNEEGVDIMNKKNEFNKEQDNAWVDQDTPWIKRDVSTSSWQPPPPKRESSFTRGDNTSTYDIETPKTRPAGGVNTYNSHNDLKLPGYDACISGTYGGGSGSRNSSQNSLKKGDSIVFTVDVDEGDTDYPPVILTRYPAYNPVQSSSGGSSVNNSQACSPTLTNATQQNYSSNNITSQQQPQPNSQLISQQSPLTPTLRHNIGNTYDVLDNSTEIV